MVVNGVTSEWKDVTRGVPQGTILGPLLFTLFVNDMPAVVKRCTIHQYADDATIYASSKDSRKVGSALEEDLERIANWISANGLVMNIAKTQLMVLSRRGRQAKEKVNVRVDEVDLPQQEHMKLLGVVVDNELKWKQQIDCVGRKNLACLANIRRAGRYLPSHIRKLLYTSMVLPHLDYCSVVWNDCNAGLCNRARTMPCASFLANLL